MKKIIKLIDISKSFGDHNVLNNINLEVSEGSMVAIVGESGSGKSTLLNIMGTLEKPTSGKVVIMDQENVKPGSTKSMYLLRDTISYLFQNYALIDNETVESNLKIADKYSKESKISMIEALNIVGLSGFEKKKIYTLSGGEQQRIALARTLIKPGNIILADEPTGNVDFDNKIMIMEIFKTMKNMGKTIIVVTHDKDLLDYFDTVFDLSDVLVN